MIALLALLMLLCCAQAGLGGTTAQRKAYVYEQIQQRGHILVWATKDGVRLKNLVWNLEVVTKAPTWQVVVFNKTAKTYAKETLKVWVREGLDVTRDMERPVFPASTRIGTVTRFGHKCGIYLEPANITIVDPMTHAPTGFISGLRYELLDESDFDPNVALAISSNYGLLPSKQLAINADRNYRDKGWTKDLRTLNFKEIPLKDAQIEYPNLTGYKECESPSVVLMSGRPKAIPEELIFDPDRKP